MSFLDTLANSQFSKNSFMPRTDPSRRYIPSRTTPTLQLEADKYSWHILTSSKADQDDKRYPKPQSNQNPAQTILSPRTQIIPLPLLQRPLPRRPLLNPHPPSM